MRRRAGCMGLVLALLAPSLRAQEVTTQVLRDGTAGPDASVQPVDRDPSLGLVIPEELGAPLGSDTVLHSFLRFDVAEGDMVTFTTNFNAATGSRGASQIIARVTGGSPSQILGWVGSNANGLVGLPTGPDFTPFRLFFLNPAGVLIGPRGGITSPNELTVSTASELLFEGGESLSSLAGSSLPILSTTHVTGFGFPAAGSSGSIVVEGGFDSNNTFLIAADPGRLTVPDAPSSGGLVSLSGGRSTSSEGGFTAVGKSIDIHDYQLDIFFGRFQSQGDLRIADSEISVVTQTPDSRTPALRLGFQAGSSIVLERTNVDAGSSPPFLMRLPGGSIDFADLSRGGVLIDNSNLADFLRFSVAFVGGNVELRAPSIRIEDSSITTTLNTPAIEAKQVGAGNIDVIGDRVIVTRSRLTAVGGLFAQGGEIRLTARDLLDVADSSFSASSDQTIAGDVILTAPRVRILSSQISNEALVSVQPNPLVDRTVVSAGSIRITADSLEILDSAFSSSLRPFDEFTRGDGPTEASAGDIELRASDLQIARSQLSTTVDATRSEQLGSIRIDAERLRIEDSILTSAALEGNAGSVSLAASSASLSNTLLLSTAAQAGAAGSVAVSGSDVALDRSFVLSSNQGTGPAGAVRVEADRLTLRASQLATDAQQGPPAGQPAEGNIELAVTDALRLEGGSRIDASVRQGQGGDVRIGSPQTVVLRDGSQILATTDAGTGGRIDIRAGAFLSDATSRVSADAGVGASGSVEIRSPDVDLQGGLSPLSLAFVSASALLPSCEARLVEGETDSLYVAREPGMPASPEELLIAFDSSDGVPQPDVATSSTGSGGSSARALLQQAQSQQASGEYAQSLETLRSALARSEPAQDAVQLAAMLAASGNAQQALGRSGAAEELLTRGGNLALEQGANALASRIRNDLGNHYAASGASAPARASYEVALELAEKSGDRLGAARALANAARAALESGDDASAGALLALADERVSALAGDRAKAMLLIHLGFSHEQRAFASADREVREASLLRAHGSLRAAAELARTLSEKRLLSYALGNLAKLYQSERRLPEALALTREALQHAESAAAPDALYRWHWLEGQLLWASGKAEPAVQSYRRAVQTLEATRQESRARYGLQATTFGRSLAPVYLDLTDALLRGADLLEDRKAKEPLLVEARATIEQLKAAELRNYLRDDCSAQLEARTASVDSLTAGAAVVYPIAMGDRLELLVRLPSGLERFTVPVSAADVEGTAREFRRQVQDRSSAGYRVSARRLYDWLVRPYAARLSTEGVTTLVFVPDGALRTIPMAALHDGSHFLAESFALATAPGLSLVDARPLDVGNVKPLLGGVSEANGEFPALASVPRELAAIRELFGGEQLLDEGFRTERIQSAIAESRPTLVHLASHAVFTGDPATSFLLTHDGRMSMEELGGALTRTRLRADPIELIVLSACDTAVGDDRAALGLAGVAVRSGARSAVGSLWAIADDATYPLVVSFYRHLHETGQSRAEALRKSQREMIASERFSHPFYWSAFVLISNWL